MWRGSWLSYTFTYGLYTCSGRIIMFSKWLRAFTRAQLTVNWDRLSTNEDNFLSLLRIFRIKFHCECRLYDEDLDYWNRLNLMVALALDPQVSLSKRNKWPLQRKNPNKITMLAPYLVKTATHGIRLVVSVELQISTLFLFFHICWSYFTIDLSRNRKNPSLRTPNLQVRG